MKAWVIFSLSARLRHIGHLDLMRALQRSLRRSGLPVAYSQGFNPHILLSLAAPLSVGMWGEHEVMEIVLEKPVNASDLLASFNKALPDGIRALQYIPRASDAPAPMACVFAGQFVFNFLSGGEELLSHVPAYLKQEQIPAVRRSKKGDVSFDLRPLIYNMFVKDGALHAVLALSQDGTARPEIVLNTLAQFANLPVPGTLISRTRLLDRRFVPLEDA